MGTWKNIRDNVRDIGGGIGSVFRGKPTTDREREVARNEKKFDKLEKNPIPNTSGYTPVKDSYGRVTYSGGGGGGSSSRSSRSSGPSQAQIAAAKAAEQKRQAELQRKQAEAKKLADEVKSVKLAKIQSQTIGGQVSSTTSPGPKAFTSPEVQAYNPEQRYIDTPYKRSKWDSTISAVGGLFADIKTGNQGSPNKYIDEYKYSEGIKRDKVAYVNPIFGTVITDPVTGKAETGEVTYGDIQRGVEDRRMLI